MSMEFCREHGTYDSDFHMDGCPKCPESRSDYDADVALAESFFTLPVVEDTHAERCSHVEVMS